MDWTEGDDRRRKGLYLFSDGRYYGSLGFREAHHWSSISFFAFFSDLGLNDCFLFRNLF
jgi:hypothetical protein